MGMESAILGLIAQYGLPLVALVCVVVYVVKRLEKYFDNQSKKDEESRKYMVDRIEKSEVRQEEIAKTNRELSETNKILVERFTIEMSGVKVELAEIKHDVTDIKEGLKR